MGKAIMCMASAFLVAAGVGILATGERLAEGVPYTQTAEKVSVVGEISRP